MTTRIDPDKYYTPLSIANKAFEHAQLISEPIICADTACGSGNLLLAAENVFQTKYCVGIDNDPHVIRQLRRERPDWRLYVGDFLKRHRPPPTKFPNAPFGVDLLVLNPPFSQGHKKHICIKYLGNSLKCSISMAHILRSLELFKPNQGAIAVVPESLLHSNTDQNARELLDDNFSLSELFQLGIYTFKGARVNSSFVQFSPRGSKSNIRADSVLSLEVIPATVTRGGLQMHSFQRVTSGTRVIHSTSLKPLSTQGITSIEQKTSIQAKGRVSGWMLLLPRVGIPKLDAFQVFYFHEKVQLSDCVIGIQFTNKTDSHRAENIIRENWEALVNLYKGTGARYIIIDRLIDWLCSHGIQDQSAMAEIKKLKIK